MTETPETGDPWSKLVALVAEAWPLGRWQGVGVVVGCSGGADSVGLLTSLCRLREPCVDPTAIPPRGFLVAAHFNHGLRADESDADEAFVRELASRHKIRFAAGRAEAPHHDEATMRTERMRFLTDTAHEMGARYIALAHSADDNVETVLHHMMRGTGPAGLSGIGSPRSLDQDLVLVRPLLHIRRHLIRSGLESIGQPWREDPSNENTHYRRNWIRHQLIPLIQSEYPSAVDAIGRAIDGQRDWRAMIDQLALEWLSTHRQCDDPLALRRDPTAELSIVIAAVQALWTERGWSRGEMTREHWLRIATTIQSQSLERYTLPGQIDVDALREDVELRKQGI